MSRPPDGSQLSRHCLYAEFIVKGINPKSTCIYCGINVETRILAYIIETTNVLILCICMQILNSRNIFHKSINDTCTIKNMIMCNLICNSLLYKIIDIPQISES